MHVIMMCAACGVTAAPVSQGLHPIVAEAPQQLPHMSLAGEILIGVGRCIVTRFCHAFVPVHAVTRAVCLRVCEMVL